MIPSFSKVMKEPNFVTIPIGFYRDNQANMASDTVTLCHAGASFTVGMYKKMALVRFQHDWRVFARSVSIEIGDIVIFRLVGNGKFSVHVYDATNGVLKQHDGDNRLPDHQNKHVVQQVHPQVYDLTNQNNKKQVIDKAQVQAVHRLPDHQNKQVDKVQQVHHQDPHEVHDLKHRLPNQNNNKQAQVQAVHEIQVQMFPTGPQIRCYARKKRRNDKFPLIEVKQEVNEVSEESPL